MAGQQPSDTILCPNCGASMRRDSKRCWLCQVVLSVDPVPRPAAGSPPAAPPQFALSTLLLVMTLVYVGVGLFAIAPGFVMLYALVVAPALVRLTVAGDRAAQRGAVWSTADKISSFVVSVGIILTAWVGAAVALIIGCLFACSYTVGLGQITRTSRNLFYLAVVVSLVVFVSILVITWPKRK